MAKPNAFKATLPSVLTGEKDEHDSNNMDSIEQSVMRHPQDASHPKFGKLDVLTSALG